VIKISVKSQTIIIWEMREYIVKNNSDEPQFKFKMIAN
jgi:hypothetical protein